MISAKPTYVDRPRSESASDLRESVAGSGYSDISDDNDDSFDDSAPEANNTLVQQGDIKAPPKRPSLAFKLNTLNSYAPASMYNNEKSPTLSKSFQSYNYKSSFSPSGGLNLLNAAASLHYLKNEKNLEDRTNSNNHDDSDVASTRFDSNNGTDGSQHLDEK
jgi:hypothetical protein